MNKENNVPNQELIAALEKLLSQARTGALEGFAAALLLEESQIGIAIAGAAWDAPSTTIGVLFQAQMELYRHKPLHAMS